MLSETEEGKVSEEWVGRRQFLALRFCHGRLNGSAFNNLAGALHTDRVACTLSVGGEVIMEIPAILTTALQMALSYDSFQEKGIAHEKTFQD